MKPRMINNIVPASVVWLILLWLALSVSTPVEAGRWHHRHHHGHHHHGHHHHYGGGYTTIYNQPYYPQPGYYGYRQNFYPVPAPAYVPVPVPAPVPAPVYAYPPNVMMDINTGFGNFFFSY